MFVNCYNDISICKNRKPNTFKNNIIKIHLYPTKQLNEKSKSAENVRIHIVSFINAAMVYYYYFHIFQWKIAENYSENKARATEANIRGKTFAV